MKSRDSAKMSFHNVLDAMKSHVLLRFMQLSGLLFHNSMHICSSISLSLKLSMFNPNQYSGKIRRDVCYLGMPQ